MTYIVRKLPDNDPKKNQLLVQIKEIFTPAIPSEIPISLAALNDDLPVVPVEDLS